MNDPIEITGSIEREGAEFRIRIDESELGSVGGFENAQPVKLIMWDARPFAERSEIEQISERQQLPVSVIAMGLKSRGAIREKQEYLNRLLSAE